jgi:cytochrome c|tara:strand:- start:1027 stop:1569 length:543 start_codon:yes stop_codon:yes gene_type:complete
MDSFELNKIMGAILLVALIVIGLGKFTDLLFHIEKPEQSAYKIEGFEAVVSSTAAKVEKIDKKVDIAMLLSIGDLTHGEKIFKKCSACHMISAGGKNMIGPNLWGVTGRKVGAISDYKYSTALTSYAKNWSFEELNGFLIKPASYIRGTKMSFAGLRKEKDRASVILYLNSKSDSPLPTP